MSAYSPGLTELAIEVVSPGGVQRDYNDKVEFHASAGVPIYMIFDPYEGVCATMWTPESGTYRDRRIDDYGSTITAPAPLSDVKIETAQLPVDSADHP
nr:Uma2 family endonuclease [Nocardiopsis mwathae]